MKMRKLGLCVYVVWSFNIMWRESKLKIHTSTNTLNRLTYTHTPIQKNRLINFIIFLCIKCYVTRSTHTYTYIGRRVFLSDTHIPTKGLQFYSIYIRLDAILLLLLLFSSAGLCSLCVCARHIFHGSYNWFFKKEKLIEICTCSVNRRKESYTDIRYYKAHTHTHTFQYNRLIEGGQITV